MFGSARTIAEWLYWGINSTNDTPMQIPGGKKLKSMGDAVSDASENILPYSDWQPAGFFRVVSLVLSTVLPLVICILLSQYLQADVQNWYRSLSKPLWAPTKWLLSPGWSLIHVLQGYSGWRVWSHGGLINQFWPLLIYMVYMLANNAWKPILFRAKKMDLALLGVIGALLCCSDTIRTFAKVDYMAAYLLIPDWIYLVYAILFIVKLLQQNPQKHHRIFQQAVALLTKDGASQEMKQE